MGTHNYAPLWRNWYNSQGAQGEEPPQVNQDLIALCDRYAAAIPGSEEYMTVGKEMATIYTEQLYSLGVSVAPRVIIISNRLGNAPTEGIFAGDYMFWVPYRGAQWYIKY
jgi:peptide/nickel transport system substrate-binding protein